MRANLRFTRPVVLFTCFLALSTLSAAAEERPLAGFVSGTQEELQSMTLADGNVARRLMFNLTVITDDADNPFNNATQDCFATYVFTPEGAPVTGKGSCDGITADGHLWWITVELQPDGMVEWTNQGGTGKLAGIEAKGKTKMLAELPDGKAIARFDGTYWKP